MQVKEIKRHLNGAQQVFYCDLVYLGQEAAIIRYTATEDPYKAVAAVSEGYYWQGKNYLMYKLFDEFGGLVGYRFDVCRDVRIESGQVEWTDLYLDAFVSPGGDIRVDDEAEVAEAVARGELTAADQAIIQRTRALLETEYRRIIEEAARLRAQVK